MKPISRIFMEAFARQLGKAIAQSVVAIATLAVVLFIR